jgi:hypothetical protein
MSAHRKAESIKELPATVSDCSHNDNNSSIVNAMRKEAKLEKLDTFSNSFEDGDGPRPHVVATMKDIAVRALHVDDDPTLNPWIFRMWFIGRPDCLW